MKKFLLATFILFSITTFSQEKNIEFPEKKNLLKSVAEETCKCIDSIVITDKSHAKISEEISQCIKKEVTAYQTGLKLIDAQKESEKGVKKININIQMNENSNEYKQYYYEIENYLRDHCTSMNDKIDTNEKKSHKSISTDSKAIQFYNDGIKEYKNQNYEVAVSHFKKAVEQDHDFPFAWDNLGICYRKLGDYDKALEAYRTSLKIDPTGKMPLQNIPIIYIYKKEYQKAIDAYQEMKKVYFEDPEVEYGIGQVYFQYIKDYEKSLDFIAKAYNKYVKINSPYRSDAESIIQSIYKIMKEQNKLETFHKILNQNNINFDEKK